VGNAAAQFVTAELRVLRTRGAAFGRAGDGCGSGRLSPLLPRGSGGIIPENFLKFYMQYPAFWHISDGVSNTLDC
jgi:hypothetical protein